jgi:hypothetical protein
MGAGRAETEGQSLMSLSDSDPVAYLRYAVDEFKRSNYQRAQTAALLGILAYLIKRDR